LKTRIDCRFELQNKQHLKKLKKVPLKSQLLTHKYLMTVNKLSQMSRVVLERPF
jgi:hypothetical protein